MRYGAMNFPIKPVLHELAKIADLGFDYLELAMDPPQAHFTVLSEQTKALSAALKTHCLGLVCHLPTFVYMADLTESIRTASVNEMIHSMETASDLGAEKAVLHPCYINGLGPLVMDVSRAYAMDSLETVIGRADQLGLLLCFENMFQGYNSFFTPEEFQEVFDRFPSLGMTLDVAHANIGQIGGGKNILRFINQFRDRICHVHASDNLGRRDDHLSLGCGTIDFDMVASRLGRSGYDGTVTFEVFSPDPGDLVSSRELFRSLIKT